MAISEVAALAALEGAIRVQGYRPIAAEDLTEAGEIKINQGLPQDMADVLSGLSHDPAWVSIGHQLALLRTRGHGSFSRLYLAVRKNVLCLVAVYVYESGGLRDSAPLGAARWRRDFEWTWDAFRFLAPYVGEYRVAKEWVPEVRRVVDKYGTDTNLAVAAGLSLLTSALELASASRGPCGTFIGIALGGLDPDLAESLGKGKFVVSNGPFINIPGLSGYGWDPSKANLLGRALPGGLEFKSLDRSLTREYALGGSLSSLTRFFERSVGASNKNPGQPGTDGRTSAEVTDGDPMTEANTHTGTPVLAPDLDTSLSQPAGEAPFKDAHEQAVETFAASLAERLKRIKGI